MSHVVAQAAESIRKVNGAFDFGSRVFHIHLMEKTLPKKVFLNLKNTREGLEKFDPAHFDALATCLKDWALKEGATHFTHWFQPLTGGTAEKHDSFFQWSDQKPYYPIETLKGRDLLKGEPDASSFPTGGLRSTHQARGYTTWDPLSDPFLWESGGGLVLCLPALFYSWTGFALDHKIPFLRSEEALSLALGRLTKLCKLPANRVYSTLGIEQEYFAIDRKLFLERLDLLLAQRTVYGAKSPKGQELEDHYFGSIKDRVTRFMREFEDRAIELGIPIKTRHNEVAPAQHEIAPLFEPSSVAIDHNLILMELIRSVARKHGLAALLHEKPFANINGSGKHCNWSLSTDTGINLLDPRGQTKESKLTFILLLSAIVKAVHDHAALMRASIASHGNDHRLGGSEAPPTILSIYLGDALEKLIEEIIHGKELSQDPLKMIDLGLRYVSHHEVDASDRNRTSFFAFTGNKFEFRAVGASANPAFPVLIIQTIVADSVHQLVNEIEDLIKDKTPTTDELFNICFPILKKQFIASRSVLFSGNAYTKEWEKEAEARGLPNIRKSFQAFSELNNHVALFKGILNKEELESRFEVLVEKYVKTVSIEAKLMIDLFRTRILPAALKDQKMRAKSLESIQALGITPGEHLLQSLKTLCHSIEQAIIHVNEIEKVMHQAHDFGYEAKGNTYSEILVPKMEKARAEVDHLEGLIEHALWPMPKYHELLFLV